MSLWIPPSARDSVYKKAAPPKTGTGWDAWGNGDVSYLKLPGGGVLQFDLDRLTLQDFRSMRDHYQINASLKILTFMIHQLDWSIECSDRKIAAEVERQIRQRWTRLIRGIAVAFWAGYGPSILEWDNNTVEKKVELSKVKDVKPERAHVHWKKVDGYAPPGKTKPQIKVYDGMTITGSAYPVPPENTLWYPLLMESGDYYGTKLLKPAFPAWFFSQLIHLFANRYFERFGEPLPIGRADYDADVTVNGELVNGRQAMEQIVRNLRNRSVVVMPSDRDDKGNYDFDLEYLESQMRGADFERYMSRLDEEMSLGLFTPVLLFRTADVGSYNLGVGHMQVFLWMLNALAGDIKEYMDEYVCERIKAINFSPLAPRCEWIPRKMGKENVETLRTVVNGLMSAGRVNVDFDELGDAIGLSLTERQVLDNPDEGDDRTGRTDDRIGRPERDSSGPNGPGRERETGRQIAARAASQIRNAYGTDRWPTFYPDWGYRKQLSEEVGQEAAARFFSVLGEAWSRITAGADMDLDEVIATTDALIQMHLDRLED